MREFTIIAYMFFGKIIAMIGGILLAVYLFSLLLALVHYFIDLLKKDK